MSGFKTGDRVRLTQEIHYLFRVREDDTLVVPAGTEGVVIGNDGVGPLVEIDGRREFLFEDELELVA